MFFYIMKHTVSPSGHVCFTYYSLTSDCDIKLVFILFSRSSIYLIYLTREVHISQNYANLTNKISAHNLKRLLSMHDFPTKQVD